LYALLPGQHPIQQNTVDVKNFDRALHYDGWSSRSRYSAVKFDAFSTEFQIARILDSDANIAWWMRLYPSDGASISYGVGKQYYADFVAHDVEGTSWIIEGIHQGP